MSHKPTSPIAAAVTGGVMAVFIAYVLSLAGLWTGIVEVTAPGSPRQLDLSTLNRAGLDLYAMQHVTLSGSGTFTSEFMGVQPVATSITLPLTLWAVIPALALLVGGYVAGLRRRGTGTLSIALTAVLAGIVYAAILALGSYVFRGELDPSALPSIGGVDFNPPPVDLRPALASVILSAGLFGVIFAYLGGMIASRGERGRLSPNRWWVCGKAILLIAIVIHLIVVLGFGAWLLWSSPDDIAEGEARWQIFTMSPTIAGIAYSLIHGATLVGSVDSPLQGDEDSLGARVNLYKGVALPGTREASEPLWAIYTYIVAGISLLAAFLGGALAARWGSRDGSVLTGLRIAVIFAVLMVVLSLLCRFGWSSREGDAAFTLSVALRLGWPTVAALGAVLVASSLGAYVASAYYASRRGFRLDL